MNRFQLNYTSDPRGSHWVVCDSEYKNLICARAWKKQDCNKLLDMHNSGEIQPNYENRYINQDVDLYLDKK